MEGGRGGRGAGTGTGGEGLKGTVRGPKFCESSKEHFLY